MNLGVGGVGGELTGGGGRQFGRLPLSWSHYQWISLSLSLSSYPLSQADIDPLWKQGKGGEGGREDRLVDERASAGAIENVPDILTRDRKKTDQ